MRPQARKEQMLVQEVGDEVVIYDERTCEAHRLNRTAAMAWRLADGERSVEEIGSLLGHAVDTPQTTGLAELALAELDRAGLLTQAIRDFDPGQVISRRQMIGVAAAMLPVVASIVAPTPAMAHHSFLHNIQQQIEESVSRSIESSRQAASSSSSSSSSSSAPPSSSSSSSSGGPTTPSSSSSSSSGGGPNFTNFNGNYTGSGKPGTNQCEFSANPPMTFTLNLDSSGRGTYIKRHTAAGVTFTFNNVQATQNGNAIQFTATGTFNVNGQNYTVTDNITISGNTLTGTQVFTRSTPPACVTQYNLSATKN